MLRWLSFAKQRSLVNPEVAVSNVEGNIPYGIAIGFESIRKWEIPPALLEGISLGICEVKVHLTLSLFDRRSNSFFGNTWVGAPVPLIIKGPSVVDVEYKEMTYMITRLTDPSLVGIIEMVATKFERETMIATAQYGYKSYLTPYCFPI